MSFIRAAVAAAALSLVAGTAGAADFPTRPVTLIVPWVAGATTDIHLRVLAKQAEKFLGQPVLVDSKPGANGTLGPATIAAMKPDGYTIGQFPVTVFRQPALGKVSFDPAKDFTYVIHVSGYLFGFAVSSESPWKDWKSFVAYAKDNPGKIRYGHTGTGGTPHIGAELMAEAAGIKMTPVPFKGQAETTTALLGDHLEAIATSSSLKMQVEAGQARVLNVWTPERSKAFPDAPTLKELGMVLTFTSPYGLGGPKNIDPKVVKILHDAFKQAMETPEHKKVLEDLDQPYMYMNTADYTAFALKQIEIEKATVEKLGIGAK
jgi:tripartite-type tricarboxylate transporter receptor subunit TctC